MDNLDSRPPKPTPKDLEPQRRPRNTIEKDFAALGVRMEAMQEKGQSMIKRLSEEEKGQLEDYGDQLNLDKAKMEDPEFLQSVGNTKIRDVIVLVKEGQALISKEDDLKKEITPYLIEDIRELVEDVVPRIDHLALINSYENASPEQVHLLGRDLNNLGFFRQAEIALQTRAFRECSYYQILAIKDELAKNKANWQEKGLLDKTEKPYEFSELPEKEYEDEMDALRFEARARQDSFQELLSMKRIYDPLNRLPYPVDPLLHEIDRYLLSDYSFDTHHLFKKSEPDEDNKGFKQTDLIKPNLDPRLLKTLDRFTQERHDKLAMKGLLGHWFEIEKAYLEQELNFDREEVLRNLRIEGLTSEEGKDLIITPEILREVIEARIPAYFLRNIGVFEFKPGEGKKHDDPTIENLGHHETKIIDGEKQKSAIRIFTPISVEKNTDAITRIIMGEQILKTAFHEIAHNIQETLTYSEMFQWEDILTGDHTAVTWYVGHAREINENTGKIEDFSESFSLALKHPALLEILSPARFRYMMRLIEVYTRPEEKQGVFGHINSMYNSTKAFYEKKELNTADIKQIEEV